MGQHVFRQDKHNRARTAIHGRGKGARHVLRNSFGIVDALYPLGHAFGAWAKEGTKIDFLESFTVAGVRGDIPHKQDHGGGILKRRVNANRGIGGPRPSGDKTNARTAR